MQTEPVLSRFVQEIRDDLAGDELLCPTFVDASLRARLALKNPGLSTSELARVVAGEPVLSARIVALANGASLQRGGKQVRDVRSAVTRIGQEAVCNVAIAIALQQITHARELEPFRAQAQSIWEHSLEVAAMAHVIGSHRQGISPDDAMFVGLVHDIGHLYSMWRAAQIPDLVRRPEQLKTLVHDLHPTVGAALIRRMQIPDAIAVAVLEHELDPGTLAPGSLSRLLSVANRCANSPAAGSDVADSALTGSLTAEADPPKPQEGLDEAAAHTLLRENLGDLAWLVATMRGQR